MARSWSRVVGVASAVVAVGWTLVKPSSHVACAANVTDGTSVEKTGEVNVCDASGASDQLVLEPGGVMVIVPVIVGPGALGVSTADARQPPPSTHTALGVSDSVCATRRPGPRPCSPPTTNAADDEAPPYTHVNPPLRGVRSQSAEHCIRCAAARGSCDRSRFRIDRSDPYPRRV